MKKLKCQNPCFTTRRDGMHLTVLLVACMGLCSYWTSLRVAEYSAAQEGGGAGLSGIDPDASKKVQTVALSVSRERFSLPVTDHGK